MNRCQWLMAVGKPLGTRSQDQVPTALQHLMEIAARVVGVAGKVEEQGLGPVESQEGEAE